jgi:hypothetical protein
LKPYLENMNWVRRKGKAMFTRFAKLNLLFACFACLVALSVCVSQAAAQTSGTGALAGSVMDPSGAVIPGATVIATNTGTGQTRTDTTTADGTYRFLLLPPGEYRVKFSAKGFKVSEGAKVEVTVTETAVLNQRLEVGSQTETVQVTGAEEALQTENATVGTLLGSQTVTTLPLSTRNYTQLLSMSPGVAANVTNATTLGTGSQDVNVAGFGMGDNNYLMDGSTITSWIDSQAAQLNGNYAGIGIPNPDAIQEFKIQTSQADASYGRNPGANVNVVTKSGTNALHGAAWEFLRNNFLDANDYFFKQYEAANGFANRTQVLKQNQFGGTLGGRIKKDKIFYFGSYQGTRQVNGINGAGYSPGVVLLPFTDPATSGRDIGDTSAYAKYLGSEFCPDGALPQYPSYDTKDTGHVGTQVACNGSNINPVAIAYLQSKVPAGVGGWFLPSSTNGSTQIGDYSNPVDAHEDQYMINTDWVISPKNTLSERYFFTSDPYGENFGCAIVAGGNCAPGSPESEIQHSHAATLKLTSVLTDHFVNEARVAFQRYTAAGLDDLSITDADVGVTPVDPGALITPITIFGYMAAGGSPINHQNNAVNQIEWADQISWTKGKHNLRAGFEGEYDQEAAVYHGYGRGYMEFGTFADFLLGLAGCTSQSPDYPDCLTDGTTTGVAAGDILGTFFATRGEPGGTPHAFRTSAYSAYVQDDLRLSSRLTLNLGLRWEYFQLESDKDGYTSNIWLSEVEKVNTPAAIPAEGTLAGFVLPSNHQPISLTSLSGATGVYVSGTNQPIDGGAPKDDFGPRVGLTWQPMNNGRLVVRSGGGVYYDRLSGALIAIDWGQSQPYSIDLYASDPICSTEATPFASAQPNSCPGFYQPLGFSPRTLTSGLSVGLVGQNLTVPRVYEYNLGIQYQFAPSWVAEVNYVGSRGTHLTTFDQNINLASLASETSPINGETTNSVENVNLRVPYLGFGSIGMTATLTDADLKYNALEADVRKQLSHGLTLQVAYTWSKNLTTLVPTQGESGTGVSEPGDVYGPSMDINYNDVHRNDYGVSTTSHPQRLILNYSWGLPLPYSKASGLKGGVMGGWTWSGVTTIQDGTPITVIDSRGGSIYGAANAGPYGETSTAEYAPGMGPKNVVTSGSVKSKLNDYFNLHAFTAPPAIGDGTDFGNSGMGIVLGPGQNNWDMSLGKETRVGGLNESAHLDFRADFFNTFNHPQFTNPNNDASQGTFGLISAMSVNPRILQFALKYVF